MNFNLKSLPLYSKILLWFFLNVLLLIFVFLILLNTQFRLNIDWLLSSGAGDRINVLKNLVIGELNSHPKSEWNNILQRFDNAYHVSFLIVNRDGVLLAGDPTIEIPEEIISRVSESPRFRPSGFNPFWAARTNQIATTSSNIVQAAQGSTGTTNFSTQTSRGTNSVASNSRNRPFITPKSIIRTTNPTRYWLLIGTRVMNPETSKLARATLIATSSSITQGGLVLDLKPWLALAIGAVLFSAAFWFPLVRSITRTLSRVTHATQEIANGKLETRVHEVRKDELGELATSVNHMAERLEGLIKGQKRFLGDVAHELCSPLSRLQVAVGILDERITEPHKKYVESVKENSQQIADLVSELLSFSKASISGNKLQLKQVDLCEVIRAAIKKEMIPGENLTMDVPDSFYAQADGELVTRALANILRNAVQHSGGNARITIRGSRADQKAILKISDTGPGVRDDDLPKIFDPFFRTDKSRDRNTGGVGLGLTIVRTCVEACGGTVSARNLSPTGLEITVELNRQG